MAAAVMDSLCSWCRSASWQYKCSTCDPRTEKALCSNCSMLWHSRGVARSHQLTSSYGETRSFLAWGSPQQNGVGNGISRATTEVKPAANGPSDVADGARAQDVVTNGVEDTTPSATDKEEDKPKQENATTKGPATAKKDKTEEETKQESGGKEHKPMEEEFEFEMVGESVESGEDGDAMSIEQGVELEEKTKDTSTEGSSAARTSSASGSNATMESTESRSESSGNQEKNTPLSSDLLSTPPASAPATKVSIPVLAQTSSATIASSSSATPKPANALSPVPDATSTEIASVSAPLLSAPTPVPVPAATDSSTPQTRTSVPASTSAARMVHTTRSTSQSKPVDLEKLLRWFPTTDNVLMEMLATRIEKALFIEDALVCARIGKCEEPTCRSVLLHYEHCKRDEMCGNPKCSEIAVVYRHRRACLKKDSTPTTGGKKVVCPFCVRIRQRRSLGVCAALDHLISDQRRALQGAHSEATRNFCLQSINRWIERKQPLRVETDRLNQLARESSAPIFNFPKYQWHFSDNVFIKREPTPFEVNEDTPTEQSTVELATGGSNMAQRSAEQPSETHDGDTKDEEGGVQQSQYTQGDSIPGTANFNVDFINQLLLAKGESGDSREIAQREFDGVMELGYAIVDASFCAPSKAQRCLLNCKSILDHLQHHLDLQVCNQPMCGAVEHHFAHLSGCKARDETESCEYCLRMEERRLIRSVDFMEAEQPEAEAKVQKIINDITASFTNHRPDEREQEVIQLEDELDQAEANKQELLEKLGARRTELRTVRRSMEHRGIFVLTSHRLPVHFTKTRRFEGSGSNKKRRLADSDG